MNPVAVEILQATLSTPVELCGKDTSTSSDYHWLGLVPEFEKWYSELISEVLPRWKRIYSAESGKHLIWAWSVPCPNPACCSTVPLRQSVVVSSKKLEMHATVDGKQIHFKPVGASKGTRQSRKPQCLSCGYDIPEALVQDAIQSSRQVIPVAAINDVGEIIDWDSADSSPSDPWNLTEEEHKRLKTLLRSETGRRLEKPLPEQASESLSRYGLVKFADLFSPRQLLTGLELADTIEGLKGRMLQEGMPEHKAKALTTYFSFGLGCVMQFNSLLSDWNPTKRHPQSAFSHLSYSFKRTFVESKIESLLAGWYGQVRDALQILTKLPAPASVIQANAESLPFSDESFDAIVTDPPYFDNVPYASLADFFWRWEGAFSTNQSQLSFNDPDTTLEALAITAPDEFAHRYEVGLTNCFRECFRVLKPGRLMCLVLTTPNKPHFDSYVGFSEAAGFEIVSVKSIDHVESRAVGLKIETYLIFFRKPETPDKHFGLATNSEVVLRRVDEGKPVKYEALAKLLAENLEREDIEDVVPHGSRGSDVERLQEALAQSNPKVLLEKCLGKGVIRRLAKGYDLLSDGGSPAQPVEALLSYFGFRVPAPGSTTGVHQVSELLRLYSSRLRSATNESEVTGLFLEATNQIEMLVKRGVYGWARMAFGESCDEILKSILDSEANSHVDLSRLSFGHYLRLFQELPDKIASSDFAESVRQKLGRSHIYLPKKPKKNSLIDRLNEVVQARNKVAHNKEELFPLRVPLSDILERSVSLVREMAAEHAIPQCGLVTEEVSDMWGRRSYKIQLDDGTTFEGTFSGQLDLGAEYFFFGSETNPKPVDPFLIAISTVKIRS
ncbi:hypothetical protein [Planctomicrobium sp. SH527]|uniref:hypothetical protein n=1 Tax=Planctomicrobium sp. SH527 TaxID=3448123 RepID=UPI003F5B3D11